MAKARHRPKAAIPKDPAGQEAAFKGRSRKAPSMPPSPTRLTKVPCRGAKMLPAWKDRDPLHLFQDEDSVPQAEPLLDDGEDAPSRRLRALYQRNQSSTRQVTRTRASALSSNRNRDGPPHSRSTRPRQQVQPSHPPSRCTLYPQVSAPIPLVANSEKAFNSSQAAGESPQTSHLRKSFDLLSVTMMCRSPGEWISSEHACGLLPAYVSHEDLKESICLYHSVSPLRFRHSEYSHKWYISRS